MVPRNNWDQRQRFLKQYFVAFKSDGTTTKAFKRQAYNLLEGDVKYIFVHYIGKHTVASSDPKYEKHLNTPVPYGFQTMNSDVRTASFGDQQESGELKTCDMEFDHDQPNSPFVFSSLDEVSSRKRTHEPDVMENVHVKSPRRSVGEGRVIESTLPDNIPAECVRYQHDERPTGLRSFTEDVFKKRTHILIARCVLKLTKYWRKDTRLSALESPCLSLIADIDHKWKNDLDEVSDRLMWSRLSPGALGNDQCKETYRRLVSAVIVGAYHMNSDIVHFVETLHLYPPHVTVDCTETEDNGPADPQMCSVGPHNIRSKHLLDHTAWLGDEVMNAYMLVLKTSWNRIHIRHCTVIDSFMVNRWEKEEYGVHPCKRPQGIFFIMCVDMILDNDQDRQRYAQSHLQSKPENTTSKSDKKTRPTAFKKTTTSGDKKNTIATRQKPR
ncbi:uncharacterized protein LOC124290700 [Haliotis rubra]|uniref:uncharacterized protein LOC124290700 n=1 Tax=Haliotis rubra TaxID=36100 RepID=UPI001EE58819|nr:uncharacterized protein LOC124290700 [Haliotis rubra]